MKRIGLLTSGGDCAGLNAALRAVYARAHHGYGWTVVGIRNGTAGLMERPVQADELDERAMNSDLLRLGGTILGTTNKGNPFKFKQFCILFNKAVFRFSKNSSQGFCVKRI